eukprot:scaffold1_cov402-Prasinococcus_capsulatus_cf.AAC.38
MARFIGHDLGLALSCQVFVSRALAGCATVALSERARRTLAQRLAGFHDGWDAIVLPCAPLPGCVLVSSRYWAGAIILCFLRWEEAPSPATHEAWIRRCYLAHRVANGSRPRSSITCILPTKQSEMATKRQRKRMCMGTPRRRCWVAVPRARRPTQRSTRSYAGPIPK